MSKSYAIRGSEDGLIGVASSPKRAVAIATAYLSQNGGKVTWEKFTDLLGAVKALSLRDDYPFLTLECLEECTSAEIEVFETNCYAGRIW